jgi:tetratricopeptide (TPR) repeat protein
MDDGLRAFQRGDIEGAARRWREAVRLYAETKQPQAHRVALIHLAHAYEALGHYSAAEDSLRTALRLAEEADDRTQVASILGNLGNVAVATGEVSEAERLLREAVALARQLDNTALAANILYTRGNLLMSQQQPDEALGVYRNSAVLAQQAQDFGMAARALAHAALAAEQEGQYQTSTVLLAEALIHLRQVEPSRDTAYEMLLVGRTYHRLAHGHPPLRLRAAEVFNDAAGMAQSLEDRRTLSYAWGYLGRLYEGGSALRGGFTLDASCGLSRPTGTHP